MRASNFSLIKETLKQSDVLKVTIVKPDGSKVEDLQAPEDVEDILNSKISNERIELTEPGYE